MSNAMPAPGWRIRPAPGWRIRPEGDHCLIVELGSTLTPATGARCLALADAVRGADWPGVTDVVPALTTVALHYLPGLPDPHPQPLSPGERGADQAEDSTEVSYDTLAARLHALLAAGLPASQSAPRTVEIPVCYGGAHGPDLADVARACGVTPEEVVALHSQPGSRVYALGFAPGLPYIGVHDEKLAIPRRATPRTRVEVGSVGVANRQTSIYVTPSPGGWHIIGATPLRFFDFRREPPSLLAPGDDVRFVPITASEFDRIAAEQGRAGQEQEQEMRP